MGGLRSVDGGVGLQVSFSARCSFHTNTHPSSFHGGVGSGVKNDKARHRSRHDTKLLRLQ